MRSWLHRGHAAFLTLCAVLIGVLAASAVIARPDTRKASGPAPAAQPEQRGGALVLIEGTILDLDGDGLPEIVDRDVRFDAASPAYSRIVIRSSATGLELASVVGPELNDIFGWSVAAFPDLDGDGVAEIAVAAPRATVDVNTRGRNYILSGATREVLLDCVQAHEAGFLGLGLLPVEDVDLDGLPDLLISGARPSGQTWVDEDGVTVIELIPAWTVASSATGETLLFGDDNPPLQAPGQRQPLAWRELWNSTTPEGRRDWLPGWSADVDASGAVDIADIAVLIRNFGLEASRWVRGDADRSGVIDFADITLALAQSGAPPPDRGAAHSGAGVRGEWIDGDCDGTKMYCHRCENDLPVNCEPGGGGPPLCEGPACDDDNDGTPNSYDCDSPHYSGDPLDCEDDNGDGIPNVNDPTSPRYNPLHPDSDRDLDGIPNKDDDDFYYRDERPWGLQPDPSIDDNNDGIPDINDPFSPLWDKRHPNSDPDRDGIVNASDPDDDNDGIPDINDGDPHQPEGGGGVGGAVCRTVISGPSGQQPIGRSHAFYFHLEDCNEGYNPIWSGSWGTTNTLLAQQVQDNVTGRIIIETISGYGWLTVQAQGKDSDHVFPDSRAGVFSVRVGAWPNEDPPEPACSVEINGCPPAPGIVVLPDNSPFILSATPSDPAATIRWIVTKNGMQSVVDAETLQLSETGKYEVMCVATTPTCIASDTCELTLVRVKVRSVQFGGSRHPILDDHQIPYPLPEWSDHSNPPDGDNSDPGEHSYPVCYTRGETLVVEQVELSWSPDVPPVPDQIFIEGHTSEGFVLQAPAGHFGEVIASVDMVASFPLSNWVRYVPQFQIEWFVKFGDGPLQHVGPSSHVLYLTLAEPAPRTLSPVCHTPLHLGCTGANGLDDGDPIAIVEGVFFQFSDLSVVRQTDQLLLSYYANWAISATTAAELLGARDGQCGAWCALFLESLFAIGYETSDEYRVLIPAMNTLANPNPLPDRRILIETWAAGPNLERPRGETDPLRIAEGGFRTCFGTPAFAGSGGYNEHVLHVLDSDGVPGQGGVANPLSYFCNHQVVYLNGRYYDPSYGVSFANLAELRDAQVLGLGMRVCSSEDLHPACLTSCDGVNIGDAEQYNFGGLGNNDFLQLSTTFPMVAAVGCTIDAPLPQRPQTVNIAD